MDHQPAGYPRGYKALGRKDRVGGGKFQPLSLLIYLSLTPGKVHRDQLIAELWPADEAEESGERKTSPRALLRRLLNELRQVTGLDTELITDLNSIGLNPACYELDVHKFVSCSQEMEKAKSRASIITRGKAAVNLYSGHFLEGYDTGRHLKDWKFKQRLIIASKFLDVVSKLIDSYNYDDDFFHIVERVQDSFNHGNNIPDRFTRGINRNRFQYEKTVRLLYEKTICLLMKFYIKSKRYEFAVKSYEEYRNQINRFEWDNKNESFLAELAELYEKAQSLCVIPKIQLRPPRSKEPIGTPQVCRTGNYSPFVGREPELEKLHSLLSKRFSVVFVTGPEGIGKTRLMREAAAKCSVPVWAGGETSVGTGAAYTAVLDLVKNGLMSLHRSKGPWRPALRDYQLAIISGLLPDFFLEQDLEVIANQRGVVWHKIEESATQESLVSLMIRMIQRQQGAVLVLDDVQSADSSSLECLRLLIQRQNEYEAMPVGILVASHDSSSLRSLLDPLGRSGIPTEEVALSELSFPVVAQWVSDVITRGKIKGGVDVESLTRQLFASTNGNPLLLETGLRVVLEQGGDFRGMMPHLLQSAESRTEERAIVNALHPEGSPERQCFEACVVFNGACDSDTIGVICGFQNGDSVAGALDNLVRQGWLHKASNLYSVAHSLYRKVAYRELGARRKRELHRRAAEALEVGLPETAFQVAHHLEHAGRKKEAAAYWLQVGIQTWRIFAEGDAVYALDRGLALDLDDDSETRFQLYAQQEEIQDHLGKRADQAKTLDAMDGLALRGSNKEWLRVTAYRRGRWLASQSRWKKAETQFCRALELLDE